MCLTIFHEPISSNALFGGMDLKLNLVSSSKFKMFNELSTYYALGII
jgi:hypothetical protein